MSSKKYRKKLKDQYNPKKKNNWYETDKNAERDREIILNFLKVNANHYVTSYDIMENNILYFNSQSSVSSNIKYIRENMNVNIISISGKGYQYVL